MADQNSRRRVVHRSHRKATNRVDLVRLKSFGSQVPSSGISSHACMIVICRTIMHAWDEIPDDGTWEPKDFKRTKSTRFVAFRCERCTTLRREFWSAITGDLLGRNYV